VADAFPVDSFNQPLPQRTTDVTEQAVLKKPPKWLRRPVGASFTVRHSCIYTVLALMIHTSESSSFLYHHCCHNELRKNL